MFDFYHLNHCLQMLTTKALGVIFTTHNVNIGDQNLKIILNIMKDNPYTVLNEDYHPLLLLEITKETNHEVSQSFKPILDHYLVHDIG